MNGIEKESIVEESTCSGLLRQFADGTWGALCFELGLITRGDTATSAMKQMEELIPFELECIAEGDPRTPASWELVRDFVTCEAEEEHSDLNWISPSFETRAFRGIGHCGLSELATA